MEPFKRHTGLVVPLNRANVDTDAIMPKQFLKSIKRSGFADFIFDEWRYLDRGEPGMNCQDRPKNMQFVLNQPQYQGASILLAQDNFGCGSSREHAPWGLYEYGFRVIIAPSFADIFANNCSKNGLLLITLADEMIQRFFVEVESSKSYQLSVDLENQTLQTPTENILFKIDPSVKIRLLEGLDEIAWTLKRAEKIKQYEAKRRLECPWLFEGEVG
ncbi:MAG: 3-isopropylmalate dehydratase small subunit [Gammaproteobacteria bacterium]